MNTEVDCKTPTCNRTFHSTVHVCSCESSIVLGLVDSVVWRLTEIHAARIVIFTRAYNLPNRNALRIHMTYEYTAFQ